jgi:hypothetical protein
MGIPGIDWLRRMISSPVVPRQVGSVANQLGKKFVLSESFALCGWNVSFEELKWIAEWQYVNGVNLLCQHLEGYTLRGLRKRDYPPSLFIQQPWWREYEYFNSYFARLGMMMSEGESKVEVLMLHPMRSGWILYDGRQNEAIRKLDADFVQASEALSGLHIEYHYGDETILQRHGKVEGSRLIVGKCSYRVVAIPSMKTLDKNTLELLLQFADNGGKIISMGEFPALCGGMADERLLRLNEKTVYVEMDRMQMLKHLEKESVQVASIVENDEEIGQIHVTERNVDGARILFMVNHDTEKSFNAGIRVKCSGKAMLYNAGTGTTEQLEYTDTPEGIKTALTFLPMQSHIWMIIPEENGDGTGRAGGEGKLDNAALSCRIYDADYYEEEEAGKGAEKDRDARGVVKLTPGPVWQVEDAGLNSLTLDSCRYNIDNTGWKGPVPVIKLMKELLGLKRSCDVSLAFEFDAEMDLGRNREFFLAVEKAEKFEIAVNGKKLVPRDLGWWKDSSFRKVDIRPNLRKGRNEVLLRRCFYQTDKVYDVIFGKNVYETEKNKLTYDVELESIYVVGDFGVMSRSGYRKGERNSILTEGPFVIVDRPLTVQSGDLTSQGFCFFADAIRLSQRFNIGKEGTSGNKALEGSPWKVLVDFGKPDVVLMKVFINGKYVSHLCWAPFTADITEFVKEGDNLLEVELFPGNRNLLGPHHHISGEPYSVGPSSFSGEWSWVEKKTEAIPATAEERKRNYWMDGYGFVRFGL